jgi:hypothetical protein
VAEALIAKGNPAILKREDAAEARGKAEGLAQGKVLGILEARGIAVSLAQRQEILRCQDLDRLDRWLRRAALASSAGEVLEES